MERDNFVLGDAKAVCDCCGFHFKQSQLKKRWDGAMVCKDDWEPQHPQDNIRPRTERNNVKDARYEPEYRFLAVGEITADEL
jgi:hypothetical protein